MYTESGLNVDYKHTSPDGIHIIALRSDNARRATLAFEFTRMNFILLANRAMAHEDNQSTILPLLSFSSRSYGNLHGMMLRIA
jgi:hypothetical protein